MAYRYGLLPQQYWFGMGYGQLIRWLSARQKHEGDQVREHYRVARAHSYGIVKSFAGKEFPAMEKWWPLPNDNELKKRPDTDDKPLSGSDFIKAFGAAFGK